MTNEEAKFMLHGYRSNGADADNEAFADALRQAQNDPALREWFEREQAFDAVVVSKLREVQAPVGLRESILAGKKMTPPATEKSARPWWMQTWSVSLAAAAAIVVAFTVALTQPVPDGNPLVTMEPVLQLALDDLADGQAPGSYAHRLGTFGAWLLNDDNRLQSMEDPIDFDQLRDLGCRTVDVGGHELFEVCFQRESGWFHIYILPREAVDPDSLHAEPMFHEKGGFVAASWADKNHAYLVASLTDLASLREIL